MKIKVKFYATLKELFGAEVKEVELKDGSHIQDLLNLLCNSRQRSQGIFDQSGNISCYIKILKNGRYIEFLDGVHTELGEGDVVDMFPPMGGG